MSAWAGAPSGMAQTWMTAELPARTAPAPAGRVAEAISAYENILRAEPQNHDALHYLGVAASRSAGLPMRSACLARRMQVKPDAPAVHNNLGSAHLALEQFDQALACFDRRIQLAPGYVAAHNNAAMCWRGSTATRRRSPPYRQVGALDPQNADGLYNMGVVMQCAGWFQEAADCYRQAIERAPAFFEGAGQFGGTLIARKRSNPRWRRARRRSVLQPKARSTPQSRPLPWPPAAGAGSPGRTGHRGFVCGPPTRKPGLHAAIWLGPEHLDDALTSFTQASGIDPGSSQAWIRPGNVLNDCSDYEEGLDSFDRALRIEPENAFGWLCQGYARSLAAPA